MTVSFCFFILGFVTLNQIRASRRAAVYDNTKIEWNGRSTVGGISQKPYSWGVCWLMIHSALVMELTKCEAVVAQIYRHLRQRRHGQLEYRSLSTILRFSFNFLAFT
jgi:hypothetical protein